MNKYLADSSTIVMSLIVLVVLTATPLVTAQSNTAAANQTSKQTNSNTTTNTTGASGSNPTKIHVDASLNTLQAGDHQGGVMHAQEAQKTYRP